MGGGHGWLAVRSANRDPDFRNRTKVDDLDFGRLVRNVYTVLLTRGLSGTIIYSTDSGTRAKLQAGELAESTAYRRRAVDLLLGCSVGAVRTVTVVEAHPVLTDPYD